VAVPYEPFLCESLYGGILCDPARSGDADDLALQVVELRDVFGTDQSVIHIGLDAADNRKRRTLHDSTYRRYAGNQGGVDVSAYEGGNGGGAASNEDGFNFQAFRGKESKINADD